MRSPETNEIATRHVTSPPIPPAGGSGRSPAQVVDAISLANGGTKHDLPHIERVIVSTLLGAADLTPVCILLPSTERIAELTAMVSAIECLVADFPVSRSAFVADLKPGNRVRALPDGHVFIVGRRSTEYGTDGVFLRYTEKKTLESNGSVFVPAGQLLRYETTTRKLPISRGSTRLSKPRRSAVDELAGITAYGNTALYRTRVVLVGSRTAFEAAIRESPIVPRSAPERWWGTGRLGDSFAWGTFDSFGRPTVLSPAGSSGSPLVAIARDFVDLEDPCLKHSLPHSQLIITNRFDLLMRSLDLANRIGERQRLVVLANSDRRSDVEGLRPHGWRVWEPSPQELLGSASSSTPAAVGVSGIDRTQRGARAERNRTVNFVGNESEPLHIAHRGLTELGSFLSNEAAEFDDRMQDALEIVRSVFFQATNWLSIPTRAELENFAASLARLRADRSYIDRYLGQQAGSALGEFLAGIDAFLRSRASGGSTDKGSAILDLARRAAANGEHPQIMVTGSRRSQEDADLLLRTNGFTQRCTLPTTLPDLPEFAEVAAFSILRRDMFSRLVDPWPARNVTFAGYDFEIGIYRQRLHLRDKARQRLKIDAPTRAALTGFATDRFGTEISTADSTAPISNPPDQNLDAFDAATGNNGWTWQRRISIPRASPGESSQEVRIVRFVGRSWMPITEDHRVVLLARAGNDRTKSAVEHVEVSDLQPASRILVREGSEKDVIRAIAQQIVGNDKYEKLREKASLWRRALQSSTDDAARIAKRLGEVGVRRHIVTIRSWLTNSSLIGPRSDDDVLAIAEAYPLPATSRADWKTCCDAISELRGLHLSAGTRLSDILMAQCGAMLFEPAETELAVDLDLGVVWLLEVAEIQPSSQQCPSNIVNRLQWLDAAWHDRLLSERIRRGQS